MDKLRKFLRAMPPIERTAFADRCGTTIGYLRKAVSVQSKMGVELCIAIERESRGVIVCEDLRPDVDWQFLRGSKAA